MMPKNGKDTNTWRESFQIESELNEDDDNPNDPEELHDRVFEEAELVAITNAELGLFRTYTGRWCDGQW